MQAFNPPDNLLSKSQGSTQILPNGNALVNWGSEGALTEFKPDGTPIFHAYMDSGVLAEGVENYRGFRYNWTGIPSEEPAIVVLKDEEDGSTNVYVSWNGDTRTKAWRFYEVKDGGRRSYLGESKRNSFESVLRLEHIGVETVQAEALDAVGEVLRVTSAVESELLINEFKGGGKKKNKQYYQGLEPWLMVDGQKIFKDEWMDGDLSRAGRYES